MDPTRALNTPQNTDDVEIATCVVVHYSYINALDVFGKLSAIKVLLYNKIVFLHSIATEYSH